jgi:hypothetical protein
MAFGIARCPTCGSRRIVHTLHTSCATYLRCDDCDDMWTIRHATNTDRHEEGHPRRRHTDKEVSA